MLAYQVMVEGVFVNVPEEHDIRYGFHSTFVLEANNAPNAAHRVSVLVKDRLKAHGISEVDAGMFKSYFWVHDIWEIDDDRWRNGQTRDFGFTFFRIGRIEGVFLYLRRLFLVRFRPWLMVDLENPVRKA